VSSQLDDYSSRGVRSQDAPDSLDRVAAKVFRSQRDAATLRIERDPLLRTDPRE
jgi:hypothetical protein